MGRTWSKWSDLRGVGKAFLENSSMHGLKYIAEDDRHALERFMWVFIFGIGVGASFYLCFSMWIKYDASPSMITVETTDQPLSEIEFPSVTICGQNKFSKSKLNLVMQNSKYRSFTSDDMLFMMNAILKFDLGFNYTDDLLRLHRLTVDKGVAVDELVNLTLKTMVTCDELLMDCQWKNQPTPCDQLFSHRITDDGICCGFNHLDPIWDINHQRSARISTEQLRRALMPGLRTGLTIIVDANVNDTISTTAKSNGFKLLINNAREFPQVGEMGLALSPGFEFFAGIEAFSSHSSPEIVRLSAEKRGCYFDSESTLQMYANYSMSRCLAECLLRQVMERCKCLPYIFNVNATTPLCNLRDYICLKDVTTDFQAQDPGEKCSCLPMCTDFWVNCQLSLGAFPGETFITSRTASRVMRRKPNVPSDQFGQYMSQNMAIVNVFYREPTGILYREDLRYGIEDFVASMGGALGLGFGFSFISAVEIVYFFAVRYYFNRKKRRVRVISKKLAVPRYINGYSSLADGQFQPAKARRRRF